MILRIHMTVDEVKRWEDPSQREELLARYRELAQSADVDSCEVYAGAFQCIELAPGSHSKFASRLREFGMHALADLIDPTINKDDALRQKYADQMQRLGYYYSMRTPNAGTDSTVRA